MKNIISLFLVFSILLLSGNLYAKERKGVDLIIQKKDGTQVRGELIAVKQTSLLLLERESGADVTVDIVDAQVITIEKRQILEWTAAGLLVGTGVGYLIGNSIESSGKYTLDLGIGSAIGAIIGSAIGLVGGVVVGLSTKGAKKIQINNKSDSEIQEILEKLRKKARIKNAQ